MRLGRACRSTIARREATVVYRRESKLGMIPPSQYLGRIVLYRAVIAVAGLLGALGSCALGQESAVPQPPQTDAEKAALLDAVLANQKKSDAAMLLYERVERIETRKTANDPTPA